MNYIFRNIAAVLSLIVISLLTISCSEKDLPSDGGEADANMVEVRPVLPGRFNSIPRAASDDKAATKAYDDNTTTNDKLGKVIPLPEGSTVWLIAKNQNDNSFIKKSYVVYNSKDADNPDNKDRSYLIPCTVDKEGNAINQDGSPLYLKEGSEYKFYALSPARELDEAKLKKGIIGFKVRNGEYLLSHDCRYDSTTPTKITIARTNVMEAVQEIPLQPMINQTAELKFKIIKGHGVHDLDIQPSGIEVSGLQYDSLRYTPSGIGWHMSLDPQDEPINLKHGNKFGIFKSYDYTISPEEDVNIEVAVLPMYSISKPVIVLFRLKINGVPSSYEMMLNEKDFKAGYSYGYRGTVAIKDGVEVITWQYVSWEIGIDFPAFESTE